MFYLAQTDALTYISIQEISNKEHIPKRFLEHILADLKKSHLLKSKIGTHGGYRLALSPDKISIGEIIRTLDGLLEPESCLKQEGAEICEDCQHVAQCNVKNILNHLLTTTEYVLNNTSLVDANKKSLTSM